MYHSRKNPRISRFDYTGTNYYFVTICTHEKQCIFGEPDHLNWIGEIAREDLERLPTHYPGIQIDCFVIMPNHIHAVVVYEHEQKLALDKVIGLYKSGVTRKVREIKPEIKVWQRSFHDHIIRNQSSYEKIWNYVTYNAQKWKEDCFYPTMEE